MVGDIRECPNERLEYSVTIVDGVTRPKYNSLTILSHITLAKFARTARKIFWSLMTFSCKHGNPLVLNHETNWLASFLYWRIKIKQHLPCSNRIECWRKKLAPTSGTWGTLGVEQKIRASGLIPSARGPVLRPRRVGLTWNEWMNEWIYQIYI
jgi:hypothetical protein